MSHSCAQWRGDIGAYIVGALDGCARDRVTRHLAACAGCRADYDELVPVRDWLSLLALTAGGPEPGRAGRPGRPLHDAPREGPLPAPRSHDPPISRSCPGSGNQGPAQPTGKLRGIRPRTRRWLPAAGAALAAAAAAVAVLVSSGAPARTFRAADSATGVSGHAQLHDTPTGTQIDLTASGLPGHERCILVAVTHGGTDIAGSWDAAYDGSAKMVGTSAFPANQLTALRIESDTGILLLSIRV
jgi:hypothetical protein